METLSKLALIPLFYLIFFSTSSAANFMAPTKTHYHFHVRYENVTRLSHTKPIATVNGQFPGPTIYAREGDTVVINVVNHMHDQNISIHWHGIRQLRTGWFDGPSYITQCPIQPNSSYTYRFRIVGQRGTLFWHAHFSWLRATVHGALIIFPKHGVPYPFPQPDQELAPLILGEWWNADVQQVIHQALEVGTIIPNISDAFTINGQPGDLYKCSSQDTFVLPVVRNKTYLLRIINAALNAELFFSIANHRLTVVEVDAIYTKPYITETILIAPGQTTAVLITTDQPIGNYYMAARAYQTAVTIPLDNTTATAILQYGCTNSNDFQPILPLLPPFTDNSLAANFSSSIRSLNSAEYPAKVPKKIDRNLFFTIGLGRKPCKPGDPCKDGGNIAASMNNISFVLPKIALLQAHYYNISGVFTTDFPDRPSNPFNYTDPAPDFNLHTELGTRISRIAYNSSVELILQDIGLLGIENHPIHIHGYNFFIVGQGFGIYDPVKDRKSFNLVDPQERNTVAVPTGGWAALRFRADNPGIWFAHCHLEMHNSWGLETAFLVENGDGPEQSLIPPPHDLPEC